MEKSIITLCALLVSAALVPSFLWYYDDDTAALARVGGLAGVAYWFFC